MKPCRLLGYVCGILVGGKSPFREPSPLPPWLAMPDVCVGADWAVTSSGAAVAVDKIDYESARQAPYRFPVDVRCRGVDPLTIWLTDHLPPGTQLGLDEWSWSVSQARVIGNYLERYGYPPPLPAFPRRPVAGGEQHSVVRRQAELGKLHLRDQVSMVLDDRFAAAVFTRGSSVGAITGLRRVAGGQSRSPLAFLVIPRSGCPVIALNGTLSIVHQSYLKSLGYELCSFASLAAQLDNIHGLVAADENVAPRALLDIIGQRRFAHVAEPVGDGASISSASFEDVVRLSGEFDRCFIEALAELDEVVGSSRQSEKACREIVEGHLRQTEGFRSFSFSTIVASGPNAAHPHPMPATSSRLVGSPELLLLDAGIHTDTATTDVTRVLPSGIATSDARRAYTIVLKSLIAASTTRSAHSYDIEARAKRVFSSYGFQLPHGLGHGIVHGLTVHAPKPVFGRGAPDRMTEGLCFTIEPGLYLEGVLGVRLENQARIFMGKIETMTAIPFDTRLINREMLTRLEANWLETYHRYVLQRQSKALSARGRVWLHRVTGVE